MLLTTVPTSRAKVNFLVIESLMRMCAHMTGLRSRWQDVTIQSYANDNCPYLEAGNRGVSKGIIGGALLTPRWYFLKILLKSVGYHTPTHTVEVFVDININYHWWLQRVSVNWIRRGVLQKKRFRKAVDVVENNDAIPMSDKGGECQ